MDKKLILAIKNVIIKSGHIALDEREAGIKIDIKDDSSPVTNADKKISQFIFDNLSKLTPDIPIICEERPLVDIDPKGKFWLIDPIDGTRSYIKNKDSFTVNIALIDCQIPTYGFVFQPSKELLYFTDENRKFCIEKSGSKSQNNTHNKDGFVAVVSSHHLSEQTEQYIKEQDFAEIIAIPSSIKLCMVAEGAGDIYPKFGPTMEWDIAAGDALIRAAGGSVRLISGELMPYAKEAFRNPHFIAANHRWTEG